MEPTTEPRTDIIVAMIELFFNGVSVISNYVVTQLADVFQQFFDTLFGLI